MKNNEREHNYTNNYTPTLAYWGGGEGYNLFPDPLQDRPVGHPKEIAS